MKGAYSNIDVIFTKGFFLRQVGFPINTPINIMRLSLFDSFDPSNCRLGQSILDRGFQKSRTDIDNSRLSRTTAV